MPKKPKDRGGVIASEQTRKGGAPKGARAEGLGLVGCLLLLLGIYSIVTGDPHGILRLFTWGGQSSIHMAVPKGIFYCICGGVLVAIWAGSKLWRR